MLQVRIARRRRRPRRTELAPLVAVADVAPTPEIDELLARIEQLVGTG